MRTQDAPEAAAHLAHVFLWSTGIVMCFDDQGDLMTSVAGDALQGSGAEVCETILKHATSGTEFHIGNWQDIERGDTCVSRDRWIAAARAARIKLPSPPPA